MILDTASKKINVGTSTSAKSTKNNLANRKTVKQDILEDANMDKFVNSSERIFVIVAILI